MKNFISHKNKILIPTLSINPAFIYTLLLTLSIIIQHFSKSYSSRLGSCTYILAMDCVDFTWFVYGLFSYCGTGTCLEEVTVYINYEPVVLARGWIIFVGNNTWAQPPKPSLNIKYCKKFWFFENLEGKLFCSVVAFLNKLILKHSSETLRCYKIILHQTRALLNSTCILLTIHYRWLLCVLR